MSDAIDSAVSKTTKANASNSGASTAVRYTGNSTTISQVIDVGVGYNLVVMSDGVKVKREGTWPWRNFNPGNIENGNFSKSAGSLDIPSKGNPSRYAVSPNYQTGRAAMKQLLRGSKYNNLTVSGAISRWAPSFENKTAKYQDDVIKAVGGNNVLSTLTDSQLDTMMDAIEKEEGYRIVGKITVVDSTTPQPTPSATPSVTVTTPTETNNSPVSNKTQTTDERIAVLPRTKTPEISQREKEATSHSSKAETDRNMLMQKESSDVENKKITFTDTSMKPQKIQKYVDECKIINDTSRRRLSTSKENINKSATVFSFPMKKAQQQSQPVNIPDIPIRGMEASGISSTPLPSPTPSIEQTPIPTPTPSISPSPSPSPSAPTPSPSPSMVVADFYATTKMVMGQYGTFKVYYGDTEILSDNTYKGVSPAYTTLAKIDEYLSAQVCDRAADLLKVSRKDAWLNNTKLLDGCTATINGMSGGFSIGTSNIKIQY